MAFTFDADPAHALNSMRDQFAAMLREQLTNEVTAQLLAEVETQVRAAVEEVTKRLTVDMIESFYSVHQMTNNLAVHVRLRGSGGAPCASTTSSQ